MRPAVRRTLALAAVLPILALSACSDGDAEIAAGADKACSALPTADAAATLPADFPTFGDVVLYEPSSQGKTSIVFGLIADSDFVKVRDAQVATLKAAGYTIEGTDQESVEAEAEFTGAHEGTVKVQPLCAGHVSIRYKING